jgi:signal transduction histidine kinase
VNDVEEAALRQDLADIRRERETDQAQMAGLATEVGSLTRSLAASRQTIANTNDFLAMVAHDLRAPLQVITLSSGVLLKVLTTIESGRPARKLVERIQHSTNLLSHFVSDLLDVSSVESGRLSLHCDFHDVSTLVENTCDTLAALCEEKGLVLQRDVRVAAGDEVLCDRARFLQVMSNLIGNAIKFTERGGEITVSAIAEDAHFFFSVRDTGAGISEEELPHTFEKYWKSKKGESEGLTEGGFGLGLAIVKNLVEAHRGTVSASSEKLKGSTFAFRLPRTPH